MASLVAASGSWDVWLFPSRLHKVCFSLMMEFQDNIGSADLLLRRKVKSAKDISTAPFSRLDRSCEDYTATLVHVIIVLLRSLNSSNDSNNENRDVFRILVSLDEPLRTSLENLWQGLQAEDGQGQFSDGEMRECKLRCIQVLEDLFFVEWQSYSIPNTSLLIHRFILFVVLQHLHMVTPDEVTGRISRMMYWCRSLVLYKIMFTLVLTADRVDTVEERFLFFVRDKHHTPFAAILEAKRLVFSITKNKTPLPKVIWARDGQIIGGLRVDITDVSSMICACIQELSKELINDVLLNMPTDRDELLKNKSGGPLEDNLRDTRCGYWFVSNRKNRCSNRTLGLVNHVVTDARLRRQFVDSIDDGKGRIVWNKKALAIWMQGAGKWLRKFLCIAHLIASQLARGVEFLSCAIRNTPTQIRGMYFVDGLAMMLTMYGTTDNNRGIQRPVARFLCKDTSFLLASYLVYVREMEILASDVLYGAEGASIYGRLLAVKGGQEFTTSDLLKGISRIFLKHLAVKMSIADWRHIAIAWTHRFMPDLSKGLRNGPLDMQAGHSQVTASKVYAQSDFNHPSIGQDEFQLYRKVSVRWHKLLCLRSDNEDAPPENDNV